MTDINAVIFPIVLFEMFFMGIMIGHAAGERNDPHQPKPKNWEDKLHKKWMEGFKAGEKSMAKRMSERLKNEEINRVMWEEYRGEDKL